MQFQIKNISLEDKIYKNKVAFLSGNDIRQS